MSVSLNDKVMPLSRLCGLETEHAMHCDQSLRLPFTAGYRGFGCSKHYEAILAALKEQQPSAPPEVGKKGAFFANGSAVWHESLPGDVNGLFEVCTPECNSPKNLLASSRAVDAQLFEATAGLPSHQVKLLKNCGDTRNNVYGLQENYEIQAFDSLDADQWRTKIWWLKAATWANAFILNIGMLLPWLILKVVFGLGGVTAGLACLLLPWAVLCLCKGQWVGLGELLNALIGTLLMPKTLAVSLFYRSTKIGKTYRHLTPFLVSRVIFAGAGSLDAKGNFRVGQKASSRNTDSLVFNVGFQQSIFCINGVFKDLLRSISGKESNLNSDRQRLSLAIGDSNMCEEAEYLKIATTSLVLDAIESGAFEESPKLRGTIACLGEINRDPTLKATVNTSRGPMSAIEIQQFYLNVCRRYVESLDEPPEEAFAILQRWSEVLVKLSADPETLFGRIDWVTKRALMRQVHQLAHGDQRRGTYSEFKGSERLLALKKIDTKYHEVSSEGYYYQLRNNGLTFPVLEDREIANARRMPPLSTTAAQRSRYIREFGDAIEWVSWDKVKYHNSLQPIEFSRN